MEKEYIKDYIEGLLNQARGDRERVARSGYYTSNEYAFCSGQIVALSRVQKKLAEIQDRRERVGKE